MQVEIFEIEVFKRQESIQFILRATGLNEQEIAANHLAETLKDLPLALAQATAYIKNTSISIEAYVSDFIKWHNELWEQEKPTNNYEFTVRVTWDISMRKIQELESKGRLVPQPTAIPLMQLCSFLAPDDIPRDLLLLKWIESNRINQQDATECLAIMNDALSMLEAFSLIKLREQVISIHSLVQTVCRDQLGMNKRNDFCIEALKLMEDAFSGPYGDLEEIKHRNQLLNHNQAVARFALAYNIKKEAALTLLEKRSNFLFNMGELTSSCKERRQILHLTKEHFPMDTRKESEALLRLGSTLAVLDEVDESLSIYNQLLESIGQQDEYQEILTRVYFEIGTAYEILNEPDKACSYAEKGMALARKNYANTSPKKLAEALNNLALIYSHVDKPKQATPIYLEGIALLEHAPSSNDPMLADMYSGLAMVYQDCDLPGQSIELMEKSHSLILCLYPTNDHSSVAESYSELASIYRKNNQIDEALEKYFSSIEILKKLYGRKHPLVSSTLMMIGEIFLHETEDYASAIQYIEESLEIAKLIYGEVHQEIANRMNFLSIAYSKGKNYDLSTSYQEQALKIFKLLPQSQVKENIADTLILQGMAQAQQGLFKEAIIYYEEAHVCLQRIFGNQTHPKVTQLYYCMAIAYDGIGDQRQASEYLEKGNEANAQTHAITFTS